MRGSPGSSLVRRRLAWLLRTHRATTRYDGAMGLGRIVALASDEVPGLDDTRVLAMERGAVEPAQRVVEVYEGLLGLPRYLLHAAGGCILRELTGSVGLGLDHHWNPGVASDVLGSLAVTLRARIGLPPSHDAVVDGSTWYAAALAATDGPDPVPDDLPALVMSTLVPEMSRSVGAAYLLRFEALQLLMSDARFVAEGCDAVAAHLGEPDAVAVIDAMTLLGRSDEPRATALLLANLESDRQSRRDGAIWAFETKARHRPLGIIERDRLVEAGVTSPFVPGIAVDDEVRRAVTDELAAAVMRGREDAELPAVLGEALFDPTTLGRHQASTTLMVSAYRGEVAAACAARLDRVDRPEVRDSLGELLGYVATAAEESAAVRWLTGGPEAITAFALVALAHTPDACLDVSGVLVDRARQGGPSARWAVYTAGMRGSAALHTLAYDATIDPDLRGSARWWIRHGPALHR